MDEEGGSNSILIWSTSDIERFLPEWYPKKKNKRTLEMESETEGDRDRIVLMLDIFNFK